MKTNDKPANYGTPVSNDYQTLRGWEVIIGVIVFIITFIPILIIAMFTVNEEDRKAFERGEF